jgi:hypothetical protein
LERSFVAETAQAAMGSINSLWYYITILKSKPDGIFWKLIYIFWKITE